MDIFDYDGDWDVDKKADLLNASLFGRKKKKKRGTTGEQEMNNSSVLNFTGADSDDEVYSKKEKRKIKEKRRKKRKGGNALDDENTGNKEKQKGESQWSETSKKKKFKTGDANLSQRLKKKKEESADSATSLESPSKKKKKLLLEGQQSETSKKKKELKKKSGIADSTVSHRLNKNEGNTESTVAVESNIKFAGEKERKRRHVESLSLKNDSKKVKPNDPKTPLENGEPSKKKKRKRKKKNNCKKNKYKHLALNSKEKSASTQSEDEKLISSLSKQVSTSDTGEKRSLARIDGGHEEGKLKRRKLSKEVSRPTSEEVTSLRKSKEKAFSRDKVEIFPKSVTTKESRKNSKLEKVLVQKLDQGTIQKLMQNTVAKKVGEKESSQNLSSGKVIVTKRKGPKKENSISTNHGEGENGFVPEQKEQGSSIWKSSTNMASHMKEQAMAKLSSARFRFINEQLYTQSGSDALQMFQEDREAFKVYHEGFQSQVKKWSVNPLDIIVRQLKNKQRNLVVADFGCGDARLAESIPQKVHSFDLVALNKRVTVCEMSKTPLQNETMDIAVFCLSLMGTSLSDYIKEANRVLKIGGLLKIAEVESRFSALSSFTDAVCNHGFQLLNKRKVSEMFYLLDFKKLKAVKKLPPRSDISLKACIYKKR